MSTTLAWVPVLPDSGTRIDQLKYPLQKRYPEATGQGVTLRDGDIPWLRGVADADEHCRKDAEAIIEAIEQHGAVRVAPVDP